MHLTLNMEIVCHFVVGSCLCAIIYMLVKYCVSLVFLITHNALQPMRLCQIVVCLALNSTNGMAAFYESLMRACAQVTKAAILLTD